MPFTTEYKFNSRKPHKIDVADKDILMVTSMENTSLIWSHCLGSKHCGSGILSPAPGFGEHYESDPCFFKCSNVSLCRTLQYIVSMRTCCTTACLTVFAKFSLQRWLAIMALRDVVGIPSWDTSMLTLHLSGTVYLKPGCTVPERNYRKLIIDKLHHYIGQGTIFLSIKIYD